MSEVIAELLPVSVGLPSQGSLLPAKRLHIEVVVQER